MKRISFEDQFGNIVIVEIGREKPLGLPDGDDRRPTIYIAATDGELRMALESVLYEYEEKTKVDPVHRRLVERVRESIARGSGSYVH